MKMKSQILGICALALVSLNYPNFSHAENLYVSVTGDDLTGDGSIGAPWRTIQHAAYQTQPGDIVEIREGTYRESIRLKQSGEWSNPITFRNYNGEAVTISGLEPVQGWEQVEGRLFRASVPPYVSRRNQAEQVFLEGEMIPVAQWPNTGSPLLDRSEAVATRVSSQGSIRAITTEGLDYPDDSLIGAEIIYESPDNWSRLSSTLTGNRLNRVIFDVSGNRQSEGARGGGYFYIFNDFDLLDADKEWFYDAEERQLYLQFPQDMDPASASVEFKMRDYGFNLNRISHIRIEGLKFFACTITTDTEGDGDGHNTEVALRQYFFDPPVAASTNVVLDSIEVLFPSHFTDLTRFSISHWTNNTGIILSGSYHQLINSHIAYSAGNGVSVYGLRNRVVNNHVHDVNYVGGEYSGVHLGFLNTYAVDCEIAWNTIHDSGRSLIYYGRLRQGANSEARIHHNALSNGLILTDDSGAIYSWGQNHDWLEIDHNRIHDIRDRAAGTGIYLDGANDKVVVHHNLVHDSDGGIIHNDGQGPLPDRAGHRIYHNTLVAKYYLANVFGGSETTLVQNNILIGDWIDGGPQMVNNIQELTLPEGLLPGLAEGDYRPGPDSAAADSAIAVPGISDDDRPGSSPPVDGLPDIGAFEAGVAPWTAGQQQQPQAARIFPQPEATPLYGTGTGLTASYFSGTNFDELMAEGHVNRLQLWWPRNVYPVSEVTAAPYSIRFEGEIEARFTETYTFTAAIDNGVRLYIDDQLVIDQWEPAVGEFTGTVDMIAGQRVPLRLDYYNSANAGSLTLWWESKNTVRTIVPPSQTYPLVNFMPNRMEAEFAAPLGNAYLQRENLTASGRQSLQGIRSPGDGLAFQDMAQSQGFRVRYATESPQTELQVLVDGEVKGSLPIQATRTFHDWQEIGFASPVPEGSTLSLVLTEGDGEILIDSLDTYTEGAIGWFYSSTQPVDGWLESGWLSPIWTDAFPHVYHPALEWLWLTGLNEDSSWMYAYRHGWFYTGRDLFPLLFSPERNWVHVVIVDGNAWFYQFDTGTWIQDL